MQVRNGLSPNVNQFSAWRKRTIKTGANGSLIHALIESVRPYQWIKNMLVFVALVFSKNMFHFPLFLKTLAAFGLFCLLSGAVYLINDVVDLEADRLHPIKKYRPIPSGRLPKKWAIGFAFLLASVSLLVSFELDPSFGRVAFVYFILFVSYSLVFKKLLIMDMIIVALAYVLRAVAGAEVIHVSISHWLILCTAFLALFIVISKRRHELVVLGNGSISSREVLSGYNALFLDQMIGISSVASLVFYAMYTISNDTMVHLGHRKLLLTLPFVGYGIFRYLYLVYIKNHGGSPELIFLKDKAMIVNLVFWGILVISLLYFG